jgi:hypothetical protein
LDFRYSALDSVVNSEYFRVCFQGVVSYIQNFGDAPSFPKFWICYTTHNVNTVLLISRSVFDDFERHNMIVSAMKELRKAEKSFGSFYNKLGRNNSLREEGAGPGSYSQFIRPN